MTLRVSEGSGVHELLDVMQSPEAKTPVCNGAWFWDDPKVETAP